MPSRIYPNEITQAAQDIKTAALESSGFTAPNAGVYYAAVRLSGLNAAAANVTAGLRVKAGGVAKGDDAVRTIAKLGFATAATGVMQFVLGPVYANKAETVHAVLLSSNVLDLSVGISVKFIDAHAAAKFGTIESE